MKQANSSTDIQIKSPWRWLRRLICLLITLALMVLGAVIYIYESKLKPDDSFEWVFNVKIKNYPIPFSVKKTILWASNPHIAPWLDGFKSDSSLAQHEIKWNQIDQSLILICHQCENRFKGMGADDLTLERIQVSIHQDEKEQLLGTIALGKDIPIQLNWFARFEHNTLNMDIAGENISIDTIYRSLAPHLPELQKANITGTLSIAGKIQLPATTLSLSSIEVNNFTVSGLGTEELMNTTSKCGATSNLPMNHWMVRSVISAEDQRFERHPGYDLEELKNAFDQNRSQGNIVRGGSTITQQTAKLLYTGAEKNLTRKMRELLYAVEMEQTLGKARIIQLYLDNAPWGLDNEGKFICGVQAAADSYFNVAAKDLKPQQAVWLAAMLHSPTREAKNWRETGKINLERALWIADYVRNAPNSGPRARQKVIDAMKRDPSLGMAPSGKP